MSASQASSQSASVLVPTVDEMKQCVPVLAPHCRLFLTLRGRYWMSLNDNGHLVDSTSTASTQRLHEMELLKDRLVWQGTAFKDWIIYVRNNHPMFSMLLADKVHPYSRQAKILAAFDSLCLTTPPDFQI